MSPEMGRQMGRRLPEWLGSLALVVASVVATLAVLELACRAWRGPGWLFDWTNFVVAERAGVDPEKSHLARHPDLGFVPKPGLVSPGENHDAAGLRAIPVPPSSDASVPPAGPILVAGDSFAYGAEVADGESWPAYLQASTGWQTINAGVPGYGLDQIVLRTERLAAALRPAAIVVSFIADDVRRSEMSQLWGHAKPYFATVDGTLALRNVPVPPDPAPTSRLPLLDRLLGWSVLADVLRSGLVPDTHEWLGDHQRALPRGAGEQMACPLMRRLADLGVPTLVVAQYDPYVWGKDEDYGREAHRLSQAVLQCAAEAGLATLDLFEATGEAVRTRGHRAVYLPRAEHHSATGNRLVAEAVLRELDRRKMIP